MGLRINTNVDALNIHNSLVNTNDKVSKSLRSLSSGYRINSAKDDAAGFAVANKFKARISSMRVAYQNASEAQAMLQTADGAYGKVQDILIRMKDLATQASSGQLDTGNLDTMNNEFVAMQKEIDRIAKSTKYGDTGLVSMGTGISATAEGIKFQVGATNNADGSNQITIKLKAVTAACLGVACVGDTNIGSDNTLKIEIKSQACALEAMNAIDKALTSINSYMGEVGAYQNRLQYTMENLSVGIENFSASESTIRDVDMAYEVMNFTKNQILQQSGMAMLAQANTAPQQVLQLLGG